MDLTQAAVSQHISRLEAEFGPLLLRKPRQLELTPRGWCCSTSPASRRRPPNSCEPVSLMTTLTAAPSPSPPPAALACCSIPCCSISNRSIPDSPSSTALPPPPT
ncbi:helix-turn-helix domain-containing protein [Aeromonas caviae]|uniref:helix-turn-helix domain-containing protein n=1 Tax=Aeromonas caviae TaxID=648 RepID=UPI003EC77835